MKQKQEAAGAGWLCRRNKGEAAEEANVIVTQSEILHRI